MISLRQISKTYADGHKALRDIDLEIGEGMHGILGPNGAGKTTLLSILVLAVEPSRGERLYFGLDAAEAANRPRIRSLIGYLPQDFHSVVHLTGLEYLLHCAELRRVSLTRHELERRARMLLDAVGLSESASRRSGTYSGGMRRRLGVAQALIHTPKLVVVDEPTAGLDPDERIQFRNLIAEVAEETAVLLSTHIAEDIEATCDRIAIVDEGRLLFNGASSELLAASRSREELDGTIESAYTHFVQSRRLEARVA
jgi:ABC-2 type transport system ATP-binding protein